jgi:hypothetical protein
MLAGTGWATVTVIVAVVLHWANEAFLSVAVTV